MRRGRASSSVVTQPGVDFGHTSIYPFEPQKARPLSEAILTEEGLTFEAHSTDYQSTAALAELVKNHFFFLKVGPELTFRLREAIWALAEIEDQMHVEQPSNIRDVLVARMNANPDHWQDYYSGNRAGDEYTIGFQLQRPASDTTGLMSWSHKRAAALTTFAWLSVDSRIFGVAGIQWLGIRGRYKPTRTR